MHKMSMESLQRLSADQFKVKEKLPVTIVLENIRSMHNVGSVFRTADCFLMEKIFLCGYTPQPPHRDIQKTALGATETVNWEYRKSAADCIGQLKDNGYRIVAVEQVFESIALQDFKKEPGKLALVFGNEVEGVSNESLALCNGALEIPQMGSKHSFNISVAAGIVLWKIFEQSLQEKLI
jgi:tRNA G18 (ribose-2'-O)-methylase SpoU